MTENHAPDAATIQKLILRAATAAAAQVPLDLHPGETRETVNETFIAGLGLISRASRLEAVVEAARPIANRLASMEIDGEDESAEEMRAELRHLLSAFAMLQAFDHREADHTILE